MTKGVRNGSSAVHVLTSALRSTFVRTGKGEDASNRSEYANLAASSQSDDSECDQQTPLEVYKCTKPP